MKTPPFVETVDLSPLRARDLLSYGGLTEAVPARVVEMTVERIECDRRELARLRAANAHLAKAAQEPGRRGLRARLKTAETELAQARWALHEAKAVGSTRAVITDARFETDHNAVRFVIAGRRTDLLLTEEDVTILRDALDREDSARTAEIASLQADIARMTRARSEGETRLAAEVVRLRAELQQTRPPDDGKTCICPR